ncbi:MAG: hypothetical protein EA381_08070 [Planctomycetaceae bacterium]|nr:MAG: hypothetical protein EA381_08070 [Planctomycetaceae bacterium]
MRQRNWIANLLERECVATESAEFPVPSATVDLLIEYLEVRKATCKDAVGRLRTEAEALQFCKSHRVKVRKTATRTRVHHQASKSLVAAVELIARGITSEVNTDPQTRCIWCSENALHVTARNVDGAVPSTANPSVIWEIKEYWGKTKGGSKMSDAIYECHLVGRELLDFRDATGIDVAHVVFVDGSEQWGHRLSDLRRFIDLTYQGLIDRLFVGRDVETEFGPWLQEKMRV